MVKTAKQMTLGSLFDGIGGFPLAGVYAGMKPVWASEIVREELYVKRRNADACLALGIITKDNSGELPVGSVPPPPARVKELLHRWLTSWRRI